ncbi:MAG: HU family DNA-binding protein [Magnetococcus sp. YQC-3]
MKERRERAGRNPRTGESIAVEAKRRCFFGRRRR